MYVYSSLYNCIEYNRKSYKNVRTIVWCHCEGVGCAGWRESSLLLSPPSLRGATLAAVYSGVYSGVYSVQWCVQTERTE